MYHATTASGAKNIENNRIDLQYGREDVDFRQGFYVTTDKKQAEEWAKVQQKRTGQVGVVMVFKVDDDFLDGYTGRVFEKADNEWANFVYNNRSLAVCHSYDFVIGPVLANPTIWVNGKRVLVPANQYKQKGNCWKMLIDNQDLADSIYDSYVDTYTVSG